MDQVEADYERAIGRAIAQGRNDEAQDLANGLREYRRFYKVRVSKEAGK